MISMKKILIFGNSGSGKTTLARQLADEHSLTHLDLDDVTWRRPGDRKPLAESIREVDNFIAQYQQWVIEGCYGSLIQAVAGHCSELHFLNPGVDICLENNLQRSWEPHKYESKIAQDKNIEMLQAWVREYESRDDECSLKYHQEIYLHFEGWKKEHKV